MLIFVGLGNPGSQYAANRHNIGFMAVDSIIHRHNFSTNKNRFSSECAEGLLAGVKILILKPQTYMNKSGQAVGEAMRFYKLAPKDVIVFHDEVDLAASKVKVKFSGGSAGHNGIKDITAHIGADYTRVRLGVGHPGAALHNHVLSDFSKADQMWLTPLLDAIGDKAATLIESGEISDGVKFMTNLAQILKPNKHKEIDTIKNGQ